MRTDYDFNGLPALPLLATANAALGVLWSLPVQWLVARRLVKGRSPRVLLVDVAAAKVVSTVAASLPVFLAWSIASTLARRAGLAPAVWRYLFAVELDGGPADALPVLAWLALFCLVSIPIDAWLLRGSWYTSGAAGQAWRAARRMNLAYFAGASATALLLLAAL
jgi:hypothetical protein